MKLDLEVWIPALRKKFSHASWVDDLMVFIKTHLICTNCKEIKPDEEFHHGCSPSRRNRYPVCKNCVQKTRNKTPEEKVKHPVTIPPIVAEEE